MSTITVDLTPEELERLQTLAERAGVSPEAMAKSGFQQWLKNSDAKFQAAAEHVLQKNAELYRRLAQ